MGAAAVKGQNDPFRMACTNHKCDNDAIRSLRFCVIQPDTRPAGLCRGDPAPDCSLKARAVGSPTRASGGAVMIQAHVTDETGMVKPECGRPWSRKDEM